MLVSFISIFFSMFNLLNSCWYNAFNFKVNCYFVAYLSQQLSNGHICKEQDGEREIVSLVKPLGRNIEPDSSEIEICHSWAKMSILLL